jgi:hypothetical protein
VLAAIQDTFQRYVLQGERAILNEIAGPDADFREARARIYYEAYRLRLLEVLESDFETLKQWVGEETFTVLGGDYLAAHPSVFRNVRWMGSALPGFLREDPRYRDRPAWSELAAFEWALGLAFDAPDAPVLTFDQLAQVAPEHWGDLRLRLHPALCWLTFDWNVLEVWNAAAQHQPIPEAGRASPPVTVAIWRQQYQSHFRSIPEDEKSMLVAVRSGASFADVCERLSGDGHESAALVAAQRLRAWVDQGWLSGYFVSDQ